MWQDGVVPKDASDSRRRLLDATAELLWERGVSGTTPRVVWERSGVGQGSYYHHFASKTALARSALEEVVERSLQQAVADLEAPGPALAALQAYVLRPREGGKGCKIGRHTSDHAVMSTPELTEPLRHYFTELHAQVRRTLQRAREQGQDVGDVDDLADTVVATLQGGYVLARATGDDAHMQRAVRGLVHLLSSATASGT
ncbi:AcrR family transcriptional regulator [Kineococcus xinjiangensis]|uniref:AcrR family transcriptional regulator n=1 Tax=Kineococcus xinjiangensis TaxID=512762 RepID=A0A2S6IVC9_9ACTN|nr:AcrR family transcriptional regulator [Kineococcus xinjiangensis]